MCIYLKFKIVNTNLVDKHLIKNPVANKSHSSNNHNGIPMHMDDFYLYTFKNMAIVQRCPICVAATQNKKRRPGFVTILHLMIINRRAD